ncbi:MAG TPA: hypothetical protein PLX89_26240 [Verrucomicrobiota bacterium]|nr:hypothetical protein [Verrucomicrobiota bacterium]
MMDKGTKTQTVFSALRSNWLLAVGVGLMVMLVLLALIAPLLTSGRLLREPIQQDTQGLDNDGMPRPAGGSYLLGTDNLGRDVLARVIHGTRVSLPIAVGAMLTASMLGVVVGLFAGYFGGRLDLALMRFTEMNLTIPAILLAVAFAGLMDGRIVHRHPASLWPTVLHRLAAPRDRTWYRYCADGACIQLAWARSPGSARSERTAMNFKRRQNKAWGTRAQSRWDGHNSRPLSGWFVGIPDPVDMLGALFDGRVVTNAATMNLAFDNNPEVTRLLDHAASEINLPQRYAWYQQAEELIVRDAPWAFLGHQSIYALRQPWLKGPLLEPLWCYRFDRVWIE